MCVNRVMFVKEEASIPKFFHTLFAAIKVVETVDVRSWDEALTSAHYQFICNILLAQQFSLSSVLKLAT